MNTASLEVLNTIDKRIISSIEEHFGAKITAAFAMKAGMTNLSYVITVRGGNLVLRINGKGTELFIDRRIEELVYRLIKHLGISDEVIIIDTKLGFKLSRYIGAHEGVLGDKQHKARSLDMNDDAELRKAMKILHKLHAIDYASELPKLGIRPCELRFDILGEIRRYEEISAYSIRQTITEYDELKGKLLALLPLVDKISKKEVLCHIDANYENYAVLDDEIKLLDFEYSRLSDPLMEFAMQALYIEADEDMVRRLISFYYESDDISKDKLFRVYYYIACGGILWANWCEMVKTQQGRTFGDYQEGQFRMAKKYLLLATQMSEREVII